MAERSDLTAQLEHLQSKYVGTGHPDITKYEWLVNQHRDSLASYVGHRGLLAYLAVAENQSMERMRANYLQRMIQPCGPPPEEAKDQKEVK